MFRFVLTYHLVLSLLVGPLLCCCTTARLGHELNSLAKAPRSEEKAGRKSCCGQPKPPANERHTPGENQKPSDPSKCPCKKGEATRVDAVPGTGPAPAASLALLVADIATFDVLLPSIKLQQVFRSAPRFEHRSFALSATELLYAHHKLRC